MAGIATAAVIVPATTGAGELGDGTAFRGAAQASLNRLIAAIPPPPEPPTLPAWFEGPETPAGATGEPDEPAEPDGPEAAIPPESAEPEPGLPGLVLDEAIFEDPRTDIELDLVDLEAETPTLPYPVVINSPVEASIDYFTARQRERFSLWLERSGRYLEMIREILRERGLPEELAYTAMVESGFNPRARSRAGARGLWQFMTGTARQYGLTVNQWVDERLDPVWSTIAAAEYLSDLYARFGHWFLAQAAYNAGEGRVARAIRRAKTRDFWALVETRHLPRETRRFVPKILAATVITQRPAHYGFEVDWEPPLAYEEVTVTSTVDLHSVAAVLGTPLDELRALNPALHAGITPPGRAYTLRVPPGRGASLEALLEEGAPTLPFWGFHRVRRGESLSAIARLYRTSPRRLAEVNRLHRGRIRGVKELLVPVSSKMEVKRRPGTPAGTGLVEVVVRRGDTLWGIAARHGMKLRTLARLNGRDPGATLYPGERLTVHAP